MTAQEEGPAAHRGEHSRAGECEPRPIGSESSPGKVIAAASAALADTELFTQSPTTFWWCSSFEVADRKDVHRWSAAFLLRQLKKKCTSCSILIAIAVVFAAGLLTVGAVLGIRRSRQKHGSSGALGAGMLEAQSLLEPSKRHVLSATRMESESTDEDTSGEPPR